MLIPVENNETSMKLKHYLYTLNELSKCIDLYNTHQINYHVFLERSIIISDGVDINDLFENIIGILKSIPHSSILYKNKDYIYVKTHYKSIIRMYKYRQKNIMQVVHKILENKDIEILGITEIITNYVL